MFREQPISRLQLGALEQARQYATADAYAADNNPFGVMNTDPQHLKDRSEREYEKLVAQWSHWKNWDCSAQRCGRERQVSHHMTAQIRLSAS